MDPKGRNEPYLIVDIDDSLTKAVLIDRIGGDYKIMGISEAPTTVDPPTLDVTVGVEKAAKDLGQKTGKQLWEAKRPSRPKDSSAQATLAEAST